MKKFDINQFKPCGSGKVWYDNQLSAKYAWNKCHRGDWMLWIAYRLGVDIRLLTLAAGYCAKTVYHLMTDERSKDAVVAAINYGRGKIGEDELKDAACAAYAATDAATDDAAYAAVNATDAAYATADATANAAAYAAYATAYAAAHAAHDAAYAVAYAAYDATDAYAAKRKNQQQTADICRKYLTDAVFNKLKQL